MSQYIIEKWHGKGKPNLDSNDRFDWQKAYGISNRSFPTTDSDEQAIAIFNKEIAKARKCFYRINKFSGGGYGTYKVLIASNVKEKGKK